MCVDSNSDEFVGCSDLKKSESSSDDSAGCASLFGLLACLFLCFVWILSQKHHHEISPHES